MSNDSRLSAAKPRRLWRVLAALTILLIIAAVSAGPIMSRVEQPDYKVEKSDGAFEIRAYAPMIAAETEIAGDRDAALGQGFRRIADYIFGGNIPNTKIDMTAPVEQQKGTSIAMTAPVEQQGAGGTWKVRFIMPKGWTMETLPKPKDERVKLIPMPERRFVVIRFSGSARQPLIDAKTAELQRYVTDKGLKVQGEPAYAFYNPPWTLPLFRRNEVMLELAGS